MKLWAETKNRTPLERARKPKERLLMCGWWVCSRKDEKRAYGLKNGFCIEGAKQGFREQWNGKPG